MMKKVLYNKGGFVAHISFPINVKDSFAALTAGATVAGSIGQVEALYDDTDGGRVRIGGVEKAGLVLEFGTMEENAAVLRELDTLHKALNEYLKHEPRKAGHAAAHRKLRELVIKKDK